MRLFFVVVVVVVFDVNDDVNDDDVLIKWERVDPKKKKEVEKRERDTLVIVCVPLGFKVLF